MSASAIRHSTSRLRSVSFVLTHHTKGSRALQLGTAFIFVTRGIEGALEEATAAADFLSHYPVMEEAAILATGEELGLRWQGKEGKGWQDRCGLERKGRGLSR
jgi:hypothetical protein